MTTLKDDGRWAHTEALRVNPLDIFVHKADGKFIATLKGRNCRLQTHFMEWSA